MSKTAKIFWLVLFLFCYKLTFLENQQPDTHYKFSIARDQHGIPHIYGRQYEDIIFAIGYAEAQDRLWSLYFKKMLMSGRTAEMFGPDMVQNDLEQRNIGYLQMAKMNKKELDPQTNKLLQAYADGINAYAKSVKMLPFQFYFLWLEWEEWTVEDSIGSIFFMSFCLEFDWFYQIARQRLLQSVGFDAALKLINFGNNIFRKQTIVTDQELKEKGMYEKYDYKKQREILTEHWLKKNMTLGSVHLPHLPGAVQGSGSNAWVIGGQYTESGRPILANDPHVASLIPNLFYNFEVVRLNKDNEIISRKFGAMPDGVPTISIGISELTSWGSTAAYIDNKDVYYQTIRNESGKMQYKFKDEWHDFRQRKEIIKVRGSAPIEQTFYHTHRGVVIESIFMDLHWKYGFPLPKQYRDNHTISLVATHFNPDATTMKALLLLLTGEDEDAFWKVNTEMLHPTIDSVFLYNNGTYGYAPAGAIPQRKIPEMGSFIKDGNSDQYDFLPELTIEQKPLIINPKKGYLAMANNKFVSDNFKYGSSVHQLVTGRAFTLNKIIQDKIGKKQKFNFKTMMDMQMNLEDGFLCQVLPQFLGRLGSFKKLWSNAGTEDLLSRLVGWDCVMTKDSIEASIYHVYEKILHDSMLTMTSLSEFQRKAIVSHAFYENYFFRVIQRFNKNELEEDDKIVCRSEQTMKYSEYHPCEVMFALAWKKLPEQLKKEFGGDDIDQYQWGQIHSQKFTNIPWSQIPLLNKLLGRSYKAGGNSRTLNVAIFVHPYNKYNSGASPAYRFITDMKTTYFSLETGQNDRILSPFFDHFMNKNKYVEYKPCNPYKEGLPKNWHYTTEKLQ